LSEQTLTPDATQQNSVTPKLLAILASVRPGRVGLPVAEWFSHRVREHGGFDLELVDLADGALPPLDEPNHPRLRRYTQEHTRTWSAIVDSAAAVAIITPEYNHGYPASIKNALDYLNQEWRHMPLGFVSYGGVSAGTRAVAQLRQVTGALGMIPVATAVTIPFVAQLLKDGEVEGNETMDGAATAMLDELTELYRVLGQLRVHA
jgi:NAD(P)H-dependent FMN reductase